MNQQLLEKAIDKFSEQLTDLIPQLAVAEFE